MNNTDLVVGVVIATWLLTMWQLASVRLALDKLQKDADELRKMLTSNY